MIEPLSVTVDKIKGSARQNIPLPVGRDETGQDLPPGSGWTKDEVKNIGPWLCNEWAGGGYYEITVTDSSEPATQHRWSTFYEPNKYPERIPPPLAGAAAQPQFTLVPPSPPSPRSTPVAFQNGLPTLPPAPAPMYPSAPPTNYYPQSQGTWPGYAASPPGYDPRLAAIEAQNRDLQAQLAREREASIQATYQRELEAVRNAARAETSRLEAKMSELVTQISQLMQGGANRGPSPEMMALQEQNRAHAEENRRLAERQEAERREREMKEFMRAQADATQRQIDQVQANFTSIVRALEEKGRGHDPLIAMFQEQQRSQMDAMKEIARSNQTGLERLQQFMMSPKDVAGLMRDSSQGVDVVANQVTRAFTNVLDVQGRLMEQITSMNQGGDSPTTLIKDGIERAGSMFERWVSGKSKEAIAAQNANAAMAQAQAQAMTAQAMAAQAHAQQMSSVVPPIPPAPTPAPTPMPPMPAPPVPGLGSVAQPKNGKMQSDQRPIAPTNGVPAEPRRLGKTDLEWFGPVLLPEIAKLRAGVARVIESVSMTPNRIDRATGKIDGITPDQAADYIAKATGIVMAQKLIVPALNDLLFQQRFADFVDVLLPDAPQGYRHELVQAIVNGLDPNSDDDEDENEDEDETEDEDGDDSKLAERSSTTATTVPLKPVRMIPSA